MVDAMLSGLRRVEDSFVVETVVARFEVDLGADYPTFVRTRRDPVIGLLRQQLEDLLLRVDAEADRRVANDAFDQGYTVGRVALDLHQQPLLYSGLTRADLVSARTPAGAATLRRHFPAAHDQLEHLQGLLLARETGQAFLGCEHLNAFLRRVCAPEHASTGALAFQFAGFGLVTSIAESLSLSLSLTPSS